MTAVTYINEMGGTHSHSCNKVAKKIWLWCISKQIWLSCSHLPGKQNILADSLSRLTESNSTEWSLRQDVFSRISAVFGKPHIDLFASSLNFKVIKFASWKADPNAFVIDAFTCNWSDHFFYAFPPFSLISRCLQKIEQDKARGILILPLWPPQPWFAKFLVLLAALPICLPQEDDLLQLPSMEMLHPLHRKLKLVACLLSGNTSETREFRSKLFPSSQLPGERAHRNSMIHTTESGAYFVTKGKLIPFSQAL